MTSYTSVASVSVSGMVKGIQYSAATVNGLLLKSVFSIGVTDTAVDGSDASL